MKSDSDVSFWGGHSALYDLVFASPSPGLGPWRGSFRDRFVRRAGDSETYTAAHVAFSWGNTAKFEFTGAFFFHLDLSTCSHDINYNCIIHSHLRVPLVVSG